MPIWKIVRIRMLFEDWLPEPFAVATWIEKSLITGGRPGVSGRFSSRTAVDMRLLRFRGGRVARRAPDDTKGDTGDRCVCGDGWNARPEDSSMRLLIRFAAAFFLAALSVAAQAQRPIRFEELAKIRRLGGFSVSPDGRQVAYAVSTPDVPANTSHSAIWMVPASGGEPRRLTAGD